MTGTGEWSVRTERKHQEIPPCCTGHEGLFSRYGCMVLCFRGASYFCEQSGFSEPRSQYCLLVCQRTVGLCRDHLGARYVWSSERAALAAGRLMASAMPSSHLQSSDSKEGTVGRKVSKGRAASERERALLSFPHQAPTAVEVSLQTAAAGPFPGHYPYSCPGRWRYLLQ